MTDKERDELKEVIRKDYPGISEAEISFYGFVLRNDAG